MAGKRPPRRPRREWLEALLASGQAGVERARSRSLVVDTAVGVVQRERPVAVGILAASLAFRLFALVIPLAYVLVAGLGFAGAAAGESSRLGGGNRLGQLVVASIAAATQTSDRGHLLALAFGGLTTLLAAAGVVEVLRWIHVLAWRVPGPGLLPAPSSCSGWSAASWSWSPPPPSPSGPGPTPRGSPQRSP